MTPAQELKLSKIVGDGLHSEAPGLGINLLSYTPGFPLHAGERYSSDMDSALEFPCDNMEVWEILLTAQ